MSLRAAILGLVGSPGFPVYDGDVPDAPGGRYAVLYAGAGWLTADDMSRTIADHVHFSFTITSVGRGSIEREFVAVTVRDALVGQVPVVEGWNCGVIVEDTPGQPRTNTDRPDIAIFYTADTYSVNATRA